MAGVVVPAVTNEGFMQQVESIKALSGPVYMPEDIKHSFSEILKSAEKVKTLSGPVYVDQRNQYNVILQHAEKIKELAGPVYQLEQFKHNYNEIQKNLAEMSKPQYGPVMTCNHKSSFNEIRKSVDRIQQQTWPV